MLRLRLLLLAAGTLLLVTSSSSAHFLWLLTGPEPAPDHVQVYFSESAEPDDPSLLDKVVGAEAWSLGGFRGEPKPLSFSKGSDALEAELPAGQSAVMLRHTYGVVERGGTSMLLKYYAKTHASSLPGTWREINNVEKLPLEVTPRPDGSEIVFRVTWNGKPLEGSTLTIVGPGIEAKIEGATDADGDFRAKLPQAGVVSIRAKHVETVPGEFEGQAYKEVRHYSTLALRYQPARLAPAEHEFAAMPKGTTSFGGALVGNTLFVFGGNYGSAHDYKNEDQSGDLWTLELTEPGKWRKVEGGPKLQGLAMVAHDGWLYRVGGFTAMNKQGEPNDLRSQPEFARTKVDRPSWEPLPALPEPRSSHDAAVVGNTLYVVGGWNMQGGGRDAHWHDTALALDLTSGMPEWKTIATPPFKRRALALAELKGKLYCLGGMQEQGSPTRAVTVYDPATNTWSEGPALLGGEMDGFGSSAFACQNALYATTQSGSIQRLNADGQTWEFLGQLKYPRFFHRLLPWGDSKLVVVGGSSMSSGKVQELELLCIGDLRTAAIE